jgi:hypothetical protein
MEAKEASALRKAWGDKPCEHPWWVEETVNGTDTGKVVCKTCGRARRRGEPEPAPVKSKTTKPATPNQQVKELDPKDITVIQQGKDPVARAAPLNQKVKDLESAVDGIAAMLGADFAFTMQEEANIASGAGKLRDALGRWRERQRKKRRLP